MVTVPELWLPILVATAVVTVAAALLWTFVRRPALMTAGTATFASTLVLTVVYAFVIGIFVAYVTGRSLDAGADYKEVYRMAATAAVLGYAGGQFLPAIRGTLSWQAAGWNFLYGAVFGLLTGGPFGWLWPQR